MAGIDRIFEGKSQLQWSGEWHADGTVVIGVRVSYLSTQCSY